MSLPSRERGLKFERWYLGKREQQVAPLAGAWIEIILYSQTTVLKSVAPLAGAWIEIHPLSHPIINVFSRSPRGSVD